MNLRDKFRYKFLQINYRPSSGKKNTMNSKVFKEIEELLEGKKKKDKKDEKSD